MIAQSVPTLLLYTAAPEPDLWRAQVGACAAACGMQLLVTPWGRPPAADRAALLLDLRDLAAGPALERVAELCGQHPDRPAIGLIGAAPPGLRAGVLEVGVHELLPAAGLTADDLARAIGEASARQHALATRCRRTACGAALATRGGADGLWVWDLRADRIAFSAGWKAALGYGDDAIGDHPHEWLDRIHPDDRARVTAQLSDFLRHQQSPFESEYRIRHADGGYRWVFCRAEGQRGAAARIVGFQLDITRWKQAEERLAFVALHDPLTELPNRALLLEGLRGARGRALRQPGAGFAVLCLDLDRFGQLNDSLGLAVGDALLREMARRLQASVRPGDLVARLGGDTFAVLVEGLGDDAEAGSIADRLLAAVAAPCPVPDGAIRMSASIGIAWGGGDDAPEDLLRNADTAMYWARARGRARYARFDAAMHTQASEQLRLEMDLRQAIEREELVVHYQPLVDLASGKLRGFEALVRWAHPERGLVPPAAFLPLAEETGLIVAIDRWVLATATRQLCAWQREFPRLPPLVIHINVSGGELAEPATVPLVAAVLAETGLDPRQLQLEITEGVLIQHPERVVAAIEALGKLGVGVALDDFGTGYSSLSYLHRFALQTLKLDRSFIDELSARQRQWAIVQAIVELGHTLQLRVVAEGVETAEQRDQLRDLGCDEGQGWFFARPLAPADARALLASHLDAGCLP